MSFSRRSIPIFVSAMFALWIGACQGHTPGDAPNRSGSDFTAAQAQADLRLLRRALEEAHGGLYRYSTPKEIDRRFDDFMQQADQIACSRDFASLVSELLATVRDGHLRLQYDAPTVATLREARLLPLHLTVEGRRLRVVWNETAHDAIAAPGAEVLSINDYSADELLSHMLPKIAGDGSIDTRKKRLLGHDFPQYYWVLIEPAERFRVTVRSTNDVSLTTVVNGVRMSERQHNRANNPVNSKMAAGQARIEFPSENVSLRFMPPSKIAYLRIAAFQGEHFQNLLADALGRVLDRGSHSLILDLRGNSGGVDQYGALLVSYFTDRPFRYFREIKLRSIAPSFTNWPRGVLTQLQAAVTENSERDYRLTDKVHDGLAQQSPAARPFLGELFVLIDGGTFSTAADVDAQLRHQERAMFIGEETGGGYEGNTSGLFAPLQLPNSGLRLRIPMFDYWNAVESGEPGHGVLPDVHIPNRVEDLLEGRDRPLERAIKLAQEATP